MNKKILLGSLCGIIVLSFITGCGIYDKEEKEKRNKYFAQAKENASNYIENKYGFSAEIGTTKCTFDNSDNFASNCNEEIIVNAKYNGKWFKVYIDGSKSTMIGKDNYQYDEISNDLANLFNNTFGVPYKYKFYYGYDDIGVIDTYYNGNNLNEVIETNYLRGIVEYISKPNFNNLQNTLTNSDYSIFLKLYIINYNSMDSYKKVSTHDYGLLHSSGTAYFEDEFYENEEYLKEVLVLHYGNVKYYSFN